MSSKRFKSFKVGQIVFVPTPDNYRGRCDYPNLKAIVLESNNKGTLCKLGCKIGILDQLYSRNQFQPTLDKFMCIEDINLDQEVSLRSVARQERIIGGLDYFRCNCTGNCATNWYKCHKSGSKCNSKCHSNRSCTNKDV